MPKIKNFAAYRHKHSITSKLPESSHCSWQVIIKSLSTDSSHCSWKVIINRGTYCSGAPHHPYLGAHKRRGHMQRNRIQCLPSHRTRAESLCFRCLCLRRLTCHVAQGIHDLTHKGLVLGQLLGLVAAAMWGGGQVMGERWACSCSSSGSKIKLQI